MKASILTVLVYCSTLWVNSTFAADPSIMERVRSASSVPERHETQGFRIDDTTGGAAKYVVIICIDACRPDYFDFSDVPNIRKLMSEGVTFNEAWVGHLRNDTPPGHATMATGAFPRNTGVIGFNWKDSATGAIVRPTSWQSVSSGAFNRIIENAGCSGIGIAYKKRHPAAKVASMSSDKWYAAAAFGANAADYILYSLYYPDGNYGTGIGDTLYLQGVTGKLPPNDVMYDPGLRRVVRNPWDADTWTMDIALRLLQKERPGVLLINLSLTDNFGHTTGGITDKDTMSMIVGNADRQIGRLLEAYRAAGVYDSTLFVVTSDHGMSRSLHVVDETPFANIYSQYGMQRVARLEFHLADASKAEEAARKIAALNVQGIRGMYYKEKDAHGYRYLPAHSVEAWLDSCYRYLASTFASAQSPDIVYFTEENWNSKDAIDYPYKGDHGEATWENQHVPLVMAGPNVRQGIVSQAPARVVDIAPTVLAAMKLPPEPMDGIVLADALVSPTTEQSSAQQAADTFLRPRLLALKQAQVPDTARARITSFTFTRDYTPGTKDAAGLNLTGNELMRILSYRGELYASTSVFTDPRGPAGDPEYTGCQVLRKSGSASGWQADVSFGKRYLRTDCLEVLRFTRDANGNPLSSPVEMLAAGIWDIGALMPGGERFITVALRNDTTGNWHLSRVASIPVVEKGFASCRAMTIHTDQVTGRQYLFVGAACGGIYKGVYDAAVPGRIRWIGGDEVDTSYGRAQSMCVANGSLYASFDYGGLTVQHQRGGVYRRIDGANPSWELVYRNYDPKYPTWNQTDRGITAIPAEDGSGTDVILTGVELPPEPIIVRIEPHNNHRAVTEINYAQYMRSNAFGGRSPVTIEATLAAALNYFEPFENPENGRTERFVTLVMYHPDDPAAGSNGAYFLIRRAPGVYDWGEIPSGLPAGQHLRGTRTIEKSPFPDEPNVWYFGGNFAGPSEQPPKPNTAWIYKGVYITATSIGMNNRGTPSTFRLSRNFPNPFHTSTTITYDIPSGGHTVVTVHDVLGRVVATLHDGYREAGTHTARFQIPPGTAPSGVYFCRVNSDLHSATITLVVAR